MADMVKEALERIARYEKDIEILKKFVESATQAASILGGVTPATLNLGGDETAADERLDSGARATRTRVTDNPKPDVIIPAAKEILRSHGQPMNRRELHEALWSKGLEVRGTDPVKTLGTILWRARDQIKSIDGWGYWPAEDPFDPQVQLLLG